MTTKKFSDRAEAAKFIQNIDLSALPTKTVALLEQKRADLKSALEKLGGEQAPIEFRQPAKKLNDLLKRMIDKKEEEARQAEEKAHPPEQAVVPLAAE